MEAGAEEKYSKTNRGRQQITINGVTMYGRVRNAVKECRTNLDVNQKYTHADECIGNILKQHTGMNADSGPGTRKIFRLARRAEAHSSSDVPIATVYALRPCCCIAITFM